MRHMSAEDNINGGGRTRSRMDSYATVERQSLIGNPEFLSKVSFSVQDDSYQPSSSPPSKMIALMYLLLALSIFSLQSSMFVFLNKENCECFSASNLLCASSTYGLLFMYSYLCVYKKSIDWEKDVLTLGRTEVIALLVGSTLYSVIGPYLFYLGLIFLSVPMASVVQRLEALNFLFLSYWLLNAEISLWTFSSAFLTFCGVVLAVSWNFIVGNDEDSENDFNIGIVYIVLSGYATSTSLLLSKRYLAHCNIGLIALIRVFLGATLSFLLSVTVNNSQQLNGLYSRTLWLYSLPYGFVYIFIGQISWVTALSINDPITLSVGINVLFCLALAWSAAILNTFPNESESVGVAFVIGAIVMAIYEATSVDANNTQKSKLSDDGLKTSLTDSLLVSKMENSSSKP